MAPGDGDGGSQPTSHTSLGMAPCRLVKAGGFSLGGTRAEGEAVAEIAGVGGVFVVVFVMCLHACVCLCMYACVCECACVCARVMCACVLYNANSVCSASALCHL